MAVILLFSVFAAENLIPAGGFETWNNEKNIPYKSICKRSINQTQFNGEVNDFLIKQSSKEKYSGEFSLYMTDSDRSKTNNTIYWQLSNSQLKKYRGKTIKFSAWVKQVSASRPGCLGISLWCKLAERKIITEKSMVENKVETTWSRYEVSMKIPDDAVIVQAQINCAAGWGQSGEAYFDDLELLETEPVDKDKTEKTIWWHDNSDGCRLIYYSDEMQSFWKVSIKGDLYSEISKTSAYRGLKGLRFKTANIAKTNTVFCLKNTSLNKVRDTSNFPINKSFLEFMLRGDIPLEVSINDFSWIAVSTKYITAVNDNWKKIIIPLSSLTSEKKIVVDRINFKIISQMNKDQQIELDEICLFTKNKIEEPGFKDSNIDLSFVKSNESFSSDSYQRPEISNGTFYLENIPCFFVGPWCSNGSFTRDWGTNNLSRKSLQGVIYDSVYNKNIANILGMNSMQLSAVDHLSWKVGNNTGITKDDISKSKAIIDFYKGLQGMPIVVDHAWMKGLGDVLKEESRLDKMSLQQNPAWHQFLPYCPEHPQGDHIYSDYFKLGARFTLQHGGNPFVYELFNESSYNCRCKFNRDMFEQEILIKYQDISKANKLWGSSFNNFNDAALTKFYESVPGLWVDWCKFSGKRYADVLKKYSNEIKSVDKRKNRYFTEMVSLTSILKFRGAGMDYTKIADVLDVLAVEGGRSFGGDIESDEPTAEKNEMEAAMSTHGELYSFILDLFTALGKNKKPILNNEHYCGRFSLGKRVPSKKSDFLTALWNEVFHGMSGSFFYAWEKRSWEWSTFEEAKKSVINGGYKSYMTLNPYSYPRDSLDGIKKFSDELRTISEIALPMPRLKPATVALVYSYPTLRMSAIQHLAIDKRISLFYSGLTYLNYPLEVLMEEDIPVTNLSKYQAVVLPFSTNTYPETLPKLTKYVREGGIVICASGSLSQDEYGKHIDSSAFLGLTRKKSENITLDVLYKGQTFSLNTDNSIIFKQAKAIVATIGQKPVLCENSIDNGKVYYFTGELSHNGIKHFLSEILKKNSVNKYVEIESLDGKPLEKVEFQVIDRGDKKLIFIVNWQDGASRLINVKLKLEDVINSYVTAPFLKQIFLTKNKSELWNSGSLQNGFNLILHPQESVILLLTDKVDLRNYDKIDDNIVKQEFDEVVKKESKKLLEISNQLKALKKQQLEARRYLNVTQTKCISIDLKKYVNMEFKDEVNGDKQGGWFDQGANDFRNMPLGERLFAGVPFNIIDPATNNGKSALILYGKERPYFPKKVNGIAINTKSKNIYFLHTAGWGMANGGLCHSYVIHYEDGTLKEIPIFWGKSIGSWWSPKPLPDAKIAFETSNIRTGHIGLYCYKWENPFPDKKVKTIDILSSESNVVPAVVAITIEQ